METTPTTHSEIQQLNLLKDRVPYSWEQLKEFMNREQIQFHEYTEDMACDAAFKIIADRDPVPFLYRVIPERDLIQISALVLDKYDESRLHEIMLLACHFNELLQNGSVEVVLRAKRVFFRNLLPLKDVILEPDSLTSSIYSHMTIAQDVKEAYIKLIEEFEEPVVIIGETIRKDRERNA
jgi:hypothetical protein